MSDASITELLVRWREGEDKARDDLIPLVYDKLRQIAAGYLSGERYAHTLTPTAVVNEAYLRLANNHIAWKDRTHFIGIAARLMRQVLVDYARSRRASKRGGEWQRVTLQAGDSAAESTAADIVAIDLALEKLAAFDRRKAHLVDLMIFGGLTAAEAAQALGISEATLFREWKLARAWLQRELTSDAS